MRIVRTCNDENDRNIFDHKPKFNQLFEKYLGRDWLDTENCSFEEFSEFAKSIKIYYKANRWESWKRNKNRKH